MRNAEMVEDCQRAVDEAAWFMAKVTTDDLGRPTPCTAWTVADLAGHMIWMCDVFAAGLAGQEPPAEAAPVAIGDDAAARFAEASAAAMERWRTTEWSDLVLQLPFASLPAAIGVRVFVGDHLLHTWDLATALGEPFQIPDDLASAQLALMSEHYDPDNRGPAAAFDLATDCPGGSSLSDQLVALSGRRIGTR